MNVSFRDLVNQSANTVRAHKLRSVLTSFGIAWGIASLLLLASVGEGFQRDQKKGFDKIGENVIQFRPGRVMFGQGTRAGSKPVFFNYGDVEAVQNGCPLVKKISPVVGRSNVRMSSPTTNAYFSVVGVAPAYFEICTAPLSIGRLPTMGDSDQRRSVAVIGSEVRRVLFAGRSPIGETIYAAGMPFTVVGVLQRVGEPRYPVNVAVFLPFRTAQRLFPPPGSPDPDPINSFVLQPVDPERNGETTAQVRAVLERRHELSPADKDAVECKDYVEMYRQVQLVAQAMNLFLGGVGVVTLALGAVGVMNIMLVSVSERTLEIGIRKATGATSRDILWQFFLESTYLTFGAGALGMAAGWAGTQALAPLSDRIWPPVITWELALVGFAVLTTVGLVAGLLPARRAASLPPAVALRAEV